MIQGENWYYSRALNGQTRVTIEDIKEKIRYMDESFDDCKIWVETIKDGMSYANMAVKGQTIDKVFVTDITPPIGGVPFDKQASCTTEGVATTTPAVSYTTGDATPVTAEKANWLTDYEASVTLSPDMENGKVFSNEVVIFLGGNQATKIEHADGSITASYTFKNNGAAKKITKIAAPTIPLNNVFVDYHTKDDVLTTSELGSTATVTFEDNTSILMPVKWSLVGTTYNAALEAENQFQWTIDSAQYSGKYDLNNCSPTGSVTIRNKSATTVSITGTDAVVKYTGEAIDVSKYFTIDKNAGERNYALVNGTGEGTLAGTTLTVTKAGTFVIRLTTAASGIYGTATATSTLTVGEEVFEVDAKDYSGVYDGQPHGITVTVAELQDAVVTYSTDGITYNATNPLFTDVGNYTVYYKIEKPGHAPITGNRTVTIHARDIKITAMAQEIMWGTDIDNSKYTVTEGTLAEGEKVSQITMASNATEITDSGIVVANDAKIVNMDNKDVTANYNVSYGNGQLVVKHNTNLAPVELKVDKTITSYTAGMILNVDDLNVKATYPDGYVEIVTDYQTNAGSIDMTKSGEKMLTISVTRNGKTLTKDIWIVVSATSVVKNTVTVNSGMGGGEYEAGQTVTIVADTASEGKRFKAWVVINGGIVLSDSTSCITSFLMPANAVEVTAIYEDRDLSTVQPVAGSSGEDVSVVAPAVANSSNVNQTEKEVGKFIDAKSKGIYKVTGTETVEYIKLNSVDAKTVTIPASITVNGKTYLVTSVAENAFKNSKKLTKITIGSNVKNIGGNAFSGCKNWEKGILWMQKAEEN